MLPSPSLGPPLLSPSPSPPPFCGIPPLGGGAGVLVTGVEGVEVAGGLGGGAAWVVTGGGGLVAAGAAVLGAGAPPPVEAAMAAGGWAATWCFARG
jgi:hypothetical protein